MQDLKQEIERGKLRSLYVFTGPEVGLMRVYISQIVERSGLKREGIDDIASIYAKLGQGGVFKESKVYVCYEDQDILKQEKAWSRLKDSLGKDILILVYEQLDKRTKFYKQMGAIEFKSLDKDLLAPQLAFEYAMDEGLAHALIERVGVDYALLKVELDKAQVIAREQNISINEAYYKGQDAFIENNNKDIFNLVNLVCRGVIQESYKQWYVMRKDISPIALLALLYRQFRTMLLVQACGANFKEAQKRTTLTAYEIRFALEKLGGYSLQELKRNLRVIAGADRRIKQGELPQDLAIPFVLLEIFR